MTDEQAKQFEGLAVEFALAHLAVFDRTGKVLFRIGTPTTRWCREAVATVFASPNATAEAFRYWASTRLPGGGGVEDESWAYYRPQADLMVGAFFGVCPQAEMGKKFMPLAGRVLEILGSAPAPN